MAIQAQMYPDNIMGGMPTTTTIGSQQDYWSCGGPVGVGGFGFGLGLGLDSSSNTPDHHFGYLNPSQPQQQPQSQQQFYLQQQQQLLQIHEPQQQQLKNQFLGLGDSNGLLFLPSAAAPPTKNPAAVVVPPPSIIAPAVDDCNGRTNGGGVASIPSTAFEQTVAAQVEKQRIEMENYVDLLQSQRLKQALQERRRHNIAAILSKLELRASALLRHKDEQLALAAKRATDLEELTRRVEEESSAWKRVAWENEAMVVKLNAALDQLIRDRDRQSQPQPHRDENVEDAESCCEENEVGEEDVGVSGRGEMDDVEGEEEGGGVAVGRKRKRIAETTKRRRGGGGGVRCCKGGCESGELCVLFLPCRHLCSCVDCEAFMDACPVCKSPKKAIIQVLFS